MPEAPAGPEATAFPSSTASADTSGHPKCDGRSSRKRPRDAAGCRHHRATPPSPEGPSAQSPGGAPQV
eukprot:14865416-Alexandrium_andersonii.AAC.1